MRPLYGSFVAALFVLASQACSSSSSDSAPNAQAGQGAGGSAGDGSDEPAGSGAAGEGSAGEGSAGEGAAGAPTCAPWTGDVQFGTAQDDSVLALASGPNGVIAAGYVAGTLGVVNIEPSGNSRGFIRAFSSSGAVVWEAEHDTAGSDTVEALAVNADGALLAAGRTSAAFPGFQNQGQQDAFVALHSASGKRRDLQQFGDERPQHPRRVTFIGATGALIGGFDDTFVPTNFVVDYENSFFATVQGLGAAAPTHSFFPDRTLYSDFTEGLAVDPESGDVFLSGIVTTGTQKGLFARRQASDGSVRWSKRLTTTGLEIPGPILIDADGSLWFAAAWLHSTPTSDPVLLHLDAATGDLIDSFELPSEEGGEEVIDAVRDAQGDFWLAGTAVGPAFPGATAYGDEDAIVLHVSPDGQLLDGWQIGTPGIDRGRAIAIDPCGNVILGGTTDGELVPNSALGKSDAFVLRVPLEIRH